SPGIFCDLPSNSGKASKRLTRLLRKVKGSRSVPLWDPNKSHATTRMVNGQDGLNLPEGVLFLLLVCLRRQESGGRLGRLVLTVLVHFGLGGGGGTARFPAAGGRGE